MNVAPRPTSEPLRFISLCTGGGGLDLGFELAFPGARGVLLVEREAFAVATLVAAMEREVLAPAPLWSDVRSLDGRRWRHRVDGVIGGIPCQPHSVAGKRLGAGDERDLWSAARRIVVQSGAWFVLIENVPGMLSSGGAERVWRDLRRLGFAVAGGLFSAAEVGGSHERERLFLLGVADRDRGFGDGSNGALRARRAAAQSCGIELADTDGVRLERVRADDGAIGRENAGGPHRLRSGKDLGDADNQGQPQPRRHLAEGGGRAGDAGAARLVDAIGGGRDRRAEVALGGAVERVADQWAERSADDRPLDPPRPGDVAGWRAVLERRPDLAPAVESHVRRVADGLAGGMDAARARDLDLIRTDALRLLGNGVDPLAAAYACRTLAADLHRRGVPAADVLVRMMGGGS